MRVTMRSACGGAKADNARPTATRVLYTLFVAMLTDDFQLETGLIDVQIRLLMENMK